MANNRANRDSFIICGIEDKTFNVVGVENDSHRRNQQNIVDILRSVNFAGSVNFLQQVTGGRNWVLILCLRTCGFICSF